MHTVNGITGYSCSQQLQYTEIRALDKATLAFPTLIEAIQTSPTASGTLEPIGYATTAQLTVAARTWNAGDDDLPGPQ